MMSELTIKMFNEGFAFAVVHRHINQACVKFHFHASIIDDVMAFKFHSSQGTDFVETKLDVMVRLAK
jgi:hypothetical protein